MHKDYYVGNLEGHEVVKIILGESHECASNKNGRDGLKLTQVFVCTVNRLLQQCFQRHFAVCLLSFVFCIYS